MRSVELQSTPVEKDLGVLDDALKFGDHVLTKILYRDYSRLLSDPTWSMGISYGTPDIGLINRENPEASD